jgi:hypothetical protein
MAGHQPRCWQRHDGGRLLITVALDPPSASRNLHQHRNLAGITERIVRQLSGHSMPATWGVSDPLHAAATAAIQQAAADTGVAHEIAVLGDRSWIGEATGRPRFAKELVRRFEQARANGIAASTLLYRGSGPDEHLDLIVKHGVTATCAIDPLPDRWPDSVLPRALRYGVWEIRASGCLQSGGGWFANRSLLRRIRRAAADAGIFHLLIDAPTWTDDAKAADQNLARLLRQVAHLRDRGLLEIETLAATTGRLSDVPTTTPQRSILRPLAA